MKNNVRNSPWPYGWGFQSQGRRWGLIPKLKGRLKKAVRWVMVRKQVIWAVFKITIFVIKAVVWLAKHLKSPS